MDLVLNIMEALRANFKYTYLTDTYFAKYVDFPFTEEIDNEGKAYFLQEDTKINILTLSQAKDMMRFMKPTFYLPNTTAYIENDSIHVVIQKRHIVLPMEPFTLHFITPTETSILYEKYNLTKDTRYVAFYIDYCIPLTEAETNLLSKLGYPITELHHEYRL